MRVVSWLVLAGALSACAPPAVTTADSELRAKKKAAPRSRDATDTKETEDEPEDDAETAPPEPEPEPIGPDTEWSGTLDAAEVAVYGGTGGFCRFATEMKTVSVTVTLDGKDRVRSATVSSAASEIVDSTCTTGSKTVIPANTHRYSFTAKAVAEGPVMATGAAGNAPKADLRIDVAVIEPTKARATLRWDRAEAPPELDWRITDQIVLTKK